MFCDISQTYITTLLKLIAFTVSLTIINTYKILIYAYAIGFFVEGPQVWVGMRDWG
ncbi:MAG: hypothetical protein QW728_04415 [Thermoplasmata archaeon]